MIDEQSEKILTELYPPFAEKLRQLVEALGGQWRVSEGYRSFDAQAAYFAQGRSRPGALITRDRAGYSGHNYGVVAHLAPLEDASNEAYMAMMVEAGKLGLASGGEWGDKFIEKSRVEMVILSMDECLALFKKGGLPAVWIAFDAKLKTEPASPVEAELEPAPESVVEAVDEPAVEESEPEIVPEPEPALAPVVAAKAEPQKAKVSSVVARRNKTAAKKKGK